MKRILSWAPATLTGFGAIIFAISPASAQPVPIDSIDQTQPVSRVNAQALVPALSTVTGNHIVGVDTDGRETLVGTATNGLTFEVNFRSCEKDGDQDAAADNAVQHCRGFYVISRWDSLPEGHSDAFAAATSAFLLDHPAVNAGLMQDGAPYVVRYVIADFGAPQGNFVSEFANFIRSATAFQNAIAPIYVAHN